MVELFHHVAPPQQVAIELIENSPAYTNDPNWIAAMGSSDAQRNEKFSQKVADLRKTDANVDWSGIEERVGRNRHATSTTLAHFERHGIPKSLFL
jgi:hypothetical protein